MQAFRHIEVVSKSELKKFLALPGLIYAHDPYWVAPLLMDQQRQLNRKKNPFFKHCIYKAWLVYNGPEPVGRILAYVDSEHNALQQEQTGFIGFFESIDNQEVADYLFRVAIDWLLLQGMNKVYGPMNFSIGNECGVQLSGFNHPPVTQMNHTPSYYSALFEKAGFTKAHDLYAYLVTEEILSQQTDIMQRLKQISDKTLNKEGVLFRTLNMKKYETEVENIQSLFNDFMQGAWGFVPASREEMFYIGETLKYIVDPEVVFFAEIKGKVVGGSLSVPDINQALSHMKGKLFPFGIFKFLYYKKRINRIRVLLLGVRAEYRSKGLDILFYYFTIIQALKQGYTEAELSWISEENFNLISIVEKIGAKRYKTYRMYEKNFR